MFTIAERRLIMLYYSGFASATANTLRHAMPDISEPDERVTAMSLVIKLKYMNEATFKNLTAFMFEREGLSA